MPDPALVLVVHAAATWGMAGVIWFIQLVHYPAYRDLGPADFIRFQDRATARTGFIVGPLMAVEAGTAALLLWKPATGIPVNEWWIGTLLIVICWMSTLLVQVPLHLRLKANRTAPSIERLVLTNWIRTLAWSGRALLVASWILASAAQR